MRMMLHYRWEQFLLTYYVEFLYPEGKKYYIKLIIVERSFCEHVKLIKHTSTQKDMVNILILYANTERGVVYQIHVPKHAWEW